MAEFWPASNFMLCHCATLIKAYGLIILHYFGCFLAINSDLNSVFSLFSITGLYIAESMNDPSVNDVENVG